MIADPNSTNRSFYLPRLANEFHQADAAVLWTHPIANRVTGWLTPVFHQQFREIMLHIAAREHLLCPTYVLMPDHIHLVWIGLKLESNQRNASTFLRTQLKRFLLPAKFQTQAHDHVLTKGERQRNAFAKACQYLMLNPVRAELIEDFKEWSFMGCIIPGYPTLDPREADYWPLFWKMFFQQRNSNCDLHLLPADKLPASKNGQSVVTSTATRFGDD